MFVEVIGLTKCSITSSEIANERFNCKDKVVLDLNF